MEDINTSLYITGEGTNVRVQEKTLFINEEYYPVNAVTDISLFGSYELHTSIFSLINQYGIICHFFSYYDNYLGSFYPQSKKYNNLLILEQYKIYCNETELERLKRQQTDEYRKQLFSVLKYYKRREYIDFLEYRENRNENTLIEEALNKQIYYKYFEKMLGNFEFEYRSYQNKHNEINSFMNFVYSILYKDILNSIYKQGLDPRISFTHAVNNRKISSLEYDISDHLKIILSDRFIIKMIRSGKLKKEMFELREDKYYLKREFINIIISEYQLFMNKKYNYNLGSLTGYQLIDETVKKYRNYFKNRDKIVSGKLL